MQTAASTIATDATLAPSPSQVVLFAMASLAELRESDTENHLLRVQHYVKSLAHKLSEHPVLGAALTLSFIENLCISVPLYDLGTLNVPDRILLKPGRLTADELAIVRTHTTAGHAAIVRAEKTLGAGGSPLLEMAKELTLSHQEKWNGQGYPQGLFGDQIPLSARIVALADVYDALISNKVYKDGMSHEKAMKIIVEERGQHFDPDVVDAFLQVEQQFAIIAQRFADSDDDMQQKIEYMANAIAEVTEI